MGSYKGAATHHHPCSGHGGLADRTSTRTTASTSTGLMALSKEAIAAVTATFFTLPTPGPQVSLDPAPASTLDRVKSISGRNLCADGMTSRSFLTLWPPICGTTARWSFVHTHYIGLRVVLLHEWHAVHASSSIPFHARHPPHTLAQSNSSNPATILVLPSFRDATAAAATNPKALCLTLPPTITTSAILPNGTLNTSTCFSRWAT